ncbi:MAG: zinc ribbon domain-containing protein [Candidatus Hadarchaeum sp.]|uniref:zinc ribbon domain-containing protein n=1 Tax=Candidatus Hadarchaeum sp. TaxID=2883567 RepID=UPI003D119722
MKHLVYCHKCGTKNPDDAEVCKKCGARLYVTGRGAERRTCFGPEREHEEECFGLPHGGVIVAVIIGTIIIIAGLTSLLNNLFKWNVDVWNSVWPVLIMIIGILIIAGAIYGLSQRRKVS